MNGDIMGEAGLGSQVLKIRALDAYRIKIIIQVYHGKF
jgi:hypothetical protein